MGKILYIPLDERPCNYNFPVLLSKDTEFELITPSLKILGSKKRPADIVKLWDWFSLNLSKCSSAIISIDMLLYGGIVPSRLHSFSFQNCKEKLDKLLNLKEKNPDINFYAFNLIMRCPKYSSSDEEPDYYEEYGESIFKKKYIEHRIELNEADTNEIELYKSISIPENILNDFETRREINKKVNIEILKLVKNKTIDFLIIPQDDSAPFGYTAKDQQDIRKEIRKSNLQTKVLMYPGADEIGCTLLARCINKIKNLKPKIKVSFSATKAPFIIPRYEDRILIESVKYQILAAGGLYTDSDDYDIKLFINAPGSDMQEAFYQPAATKGYEIERNLTEFIEQIKYSVFIENKITAIADAAYSNGGDIELFELLKNDNLLFKICGYAGWNTSSNTLGTVISQSMIYNIFGNTSANRNFLALRYIEDIGYCSKIRKQVTNNILPDMGFNYFNVDGQNGGVAGIVRNKLQSFANTINKNIKIEECIMPWSRMFEVGLKVTVDSTS